MKKSKDIRIPFSVSSVELKAEAEHWCPFGEGPLVNHCVHDKEACRDCPKFKGKLKKFQEAIGTELPDTGSRAKSNYTNVSYDYDTGLYSCEHDGKKFISKDGLNWEYDFEDKATVKKLQEEKATDNDIIGHPNHYCEGRKYEPKDVIRDWGLNFNLGNAVKYISRNGRKDGNSALQDLKKARQYLDFEIDFLEKEGK